MLEKKRVKKALGLLLTLFAAVFIFAALSFTVLAPPSPHNIDGQVFTDETHAEGASAGLKVKINDTVTNEVFITYTLDPGPPPLRGIFSDTINGNDNDFIVVSAWNSSNFGIANTTLASTTTTVIIVLNRTRMSEANVTILAPQNNSLHNTSSVFNITANVSIMGNSATNCNAAISFSNDAANITLDQSPVISLGDLALGAHTVVTWNISGSKQNSVDARISAYCASDGINLEGANSKTIALRINDTTFPAVTLVSPQNNSWSFNNLTFFYNVTDGSGIQNCSLFYDNMRNSTALGVPVNTLQNFTVNNSDDGQHSWLVSCADNSSNANTANSSFRFINIDDTAPNVTLLFPLNNSALENFTVIFSYNATDASNVSNCSLSINNAAVQTNYTITAGIPNNFTATLSGNDVNWTVNCSDNANNIGASGYFRILTADYFINATYIAASNQNPVENEIIRINATFFNLGSANSSRNVTVRFYEGDPDNGGVLISSPFVLNVTTVENFSAAIDYSAKVGNNRIFVVLDPPTPSFGQIPESNEFNNKANITVFISAYNIYYGDIFSDLILDSSQNLTVYAWFNITSFSATVLASDSDSILDFTSLQALGRNYSNFSKPEDFEELDFSLNMTNLTDSINRSYTFDGVSINLTAFTFFGQTVENVSIVNSTNTSSFVTGILWDKSDSVNGQYNGIEDVAFITNANKDSLGRYGFYDYEIRVPANLRRYILPNVQNTVTFYREIN